MLFIDHNLDSLAIDQINACGFKLLSFELLQVNQTNQPYILIDDYSITSEFILQLKNKGFTTIEINDLPWESKGCDILINQTPGVHLSDFEIKLNKKYFLGVDYLLLRQEFMNKISCEANKNPNSILVMMGGTDPLKIMRKVGEAIEKHPNQFEFTFIQGTKTNDSEYYEYLQNNVHGFRYFINVSAENLSLMMLESEFAIVTASTSSLEALLCKCIPITGIIAENQKFLNSQLEKLNLSINLGNLENVHWDSFFAKLPNLETNKLTSEIEKFHKEINIEKFKSIF